MCNNSVKKALVLFATVSHTTEVVSHRFFEEADYSSETIKEQIDRHEAQLQKLGELESLAADLVEELSGSRPVFCDQGGFLDGNVGSIWFTYSNLEYKFDGKELTLA